MENKIIVIGGAGAIGSNLSGLLSQNNSVIVLDNMSSSGVENIADLKQKGVIFKYCDISDKDKVTDIINEIQPDYIYNLAAHFANQNSVDYPLSDVQTNIIGLINTLEAARNIKNLKKYIFASSSCVYSNDKEMVESINVEPTETPYAINKYVGEMYCKYYHEQFSLKVISIRIFNTFGPGELPGAYRNVIPNFIDKAINGHDLVITGTGSETRDFTYVEDTSKCMIAAAESNYISGEVFNAGTGEETTIKHLAEAIIRLTGSSSKVVYKSKRDWDGVTRRVSNCNKAKNKLGYSPKTKLSEGLIETINWLKNRV